MKMIYEVLYKNGHEDIIEVNATEENAEEIKQVNRSINESFKDDLNTVINLGNGVTQGNIIRLSDVSRVLIKSEGREGE